MPKYKPHIGTDESGKGDYFGPLVVAAVYLEKKQLDQLISAGVKDSKRLTDNRNIELARLITSLCPHSIIAIGPEKYNELYAKMRNLNHLLAWGHIKAIENVLEQEKAKLVVSDKFGRRDYVTEALRENDETIQVEERHKAEDDPAVACASVLARGEFLRRLAELSTQFKAELPKGASEKVVQAASRFKTKHGPERLAQVAKLHFKITKKI